MPTTTASHKGLVPSVGELHDKPMFLGSEEVVWLKEVRLYAVERAGGKRANLGELLAAGFPVPPASA
ncbi:MAG: hypothetical protein JOZ19_03670 [Rubrobacter sp.]|nr:hypothetical protein [Rubrobacter sp.]